MKSALGFLCFYFVFLHALLAQNDNKGFYIKGKIVRTPSDTAWVQQVYLLKISNPGEFWGVSNTMIVDSAAIDEKGTFIFNNPSAIDSNTFYRLQVLSATSRREGLTVQLNMIGTSQNFAYLFLNPNSQLEFQTELAHFGHAFRAVKMDQANLLLRKINEDNSDRNKYIDRLSPMLAQLRQNKAVALDSIDKVKNEMWTLIREEMFAMKHTAESSINPYVSLFAVSHYDISSDSLFALKMLSRYQQQIPGSRYTTQFAKLVEETFNTLPRGSEAPSIRLPDKNGKLLKLESLKGKYVLVDFWASWCKPCRLENREVVKPLYSKFATKGFEVLSVSVDTEKDKWLEAIEKDGLPWLHVSNLEGFDSDIIKQYRVTGVPTTYVIDPSGKILAKNLRGTELTEFIGSLLNEHSSSQ